MWNEPSQQWWWQLKTRISIDLNKPWLKILINHKIQSKDFKVISKPFLIENTVTGLKSFCGIIFHFGEDVLKEVILLVGICNFKIFLKILIWQFIALFILSIIRSVFLYSVICQVNQWISVTFETELWWRSSDIPFFVPIELVNTVDASDQSVMSDIELSLLIEHWVLDILL